MIAVCNGPGAIYDCGCTDIPEGDCDCQGNQLDECGSVVAKALRKELRLDGNQLDALGIVAKLQADADADGICDDWHR